VALWREALLAQRVLEGGTRGYRHHPQLERFRRADEPLAAIATYLRHVLAEAVARGYRFEAGLIGSERHHAELAASAGQLRFEAGHLRRKLAARRPELAARVSVRRIAPHPLFRIVPGPIETWERPAGAGAR
jgi:hypothetical protein